ncbi:MAG: RNA polymerase sigma factor, partial [Pyrinomonadaceae bacterium]
MQTPVEATQALESMSFNSLRVGTESDADLKLCFDSDLLGTMQETVKLEQQVARIFETLREPVFHYLIAVFGNAAEAEDITQEVFLRLYRALHSG